MKGSHDEGVANHIGPESCVFAREAVIKRSIIYLARCARGRREHREETINIWNLSVNNFPPFTKGG